MLQALLAGVASIKAQQTRLNVIGNNLANVNTTAYKGSRVTFQDMIAQTLRGASRPTGSAGGTNPVQFGLGVTVAGTDVNNEQGSLNATNRPTDLAIQGNGYFMVSNGASTSFTRDGAFNLDARGDVAQSATGQRVVGWKADSLGAINTTVPLGPTSSINIPLGSQNAVQVTTRVTWAGNLDGAAIATASTPVSKEVFDSLGGAHDVTLTFTNRQSPPPLLPVPPTGAVSSWDWSGQETTNGATTAIGGSASAGNEPLYFDKNGALLTSLAAGTFNKVTVPASNGTPAFPVDLDFSAIGQLKTASQLNATDQNGFRPGSLQGFTIGQDGVITGIFTNGLTRSLGQVAMAIFPNPNGLERTGNNLWRSTDNSGIAVTGTPKSGGRGTVTSGFLEQSNVDIGNEFTDLIVTQRGFQANTKVVTTVDEMLQELINMKR